MIEKIGRLLRQLIMPNEIRKTVSLLDNQISDQIIYGPDSKLFRTMMVSANPFIFKSFKSLNFKYIPLAR